MEKWEKKIKSPLLPAVLFAVCFVFGIVSLTLSCIDAMSVSADSVELAVTVVLVALGERSRVMLCFLANSRAVAQSLADWISLQGV